MSFPFNTLCFTLLATATLFATETQWRSYAVYQPRIERAVVVDAAAQPLRYNHDSSVAWFGDRWFCVWNANTTPEEGAPGQLNYVSTSCDGLTWSAPRPAFSDPELCANPAPCPKGTQWQPNLLVVGSRLWCLWSQNSKDAHNGCYVSTLDAPDGLWTNRLLTWEGRADPVIDGKMFRLFPTQNPVSLSTGRALAPVTMMGPLSAAAAPAGKSGWQWLEKRNSVLYTDDDGATWRVSPGTGLPGHNWRQWEPTVFGQPDGAVLMFARNNLIPALEKGSVLAAEALTLDAQINPDDDGVLFDNRSSDGGFVWGLSGVCFVHLGEPAKNLRSTLPVPRGRWSRVGLALDYAKGEVVFSVNDLSERVAFKLGHRSIAGTSAALFGPNPTNSALTTFKGSVRSLTLNGTNRLFDASDPVAFERDLSIRGSHPSGGAGSPSTLSAMGTSRATSSVLASERDGKRVLLFSGASSAGVELAANEHASGDAVEFAFDVLLERGVTGTLCTVGDANQPARVRVRGAEIVLCANGQSLRCGSVTSGAWQRLTLDSRSDLTRVTLNHNPPAEVRHTPLATWLYLGEGYPPFTAQAGDSAFAVDLSSVRSRVTRIHPQ